MRAIQSERDVEELLRGAKALAVLAAWNELGLFRVLADGPKALEALPAERRALEITVPVLQHLGLVHCEGDRVRLSSSGHRLLEAGELPTARNFEFLRDQARMAEVLEQGGPVAAEEGGDKATEGGVRRHDPEGSARFLDMLFARSAESAAQCLESLGPLLPARARILDLGGGHGRYARTFAGAGHEATLFDLPHVVDYARRRHGDALGYIAGDFRDPDADFGGPYDLIFLSNIVHGEADATNRVLVRRLAGALAPGRHLVLKDMFIDEHGQDPENAVFFGLTMLFYTREGRSPTISRTRAWLREAGLSEPELVVREGFQLLRSRREPGAA